MTTNTAITTTQSPPSKPPWEVLILLSRNLEPKTIAKASCVSKSWLASLSSDHVWQPICNEQFPSIANLKHANPKLRYHRLYSMAFVANKQRLKGPPKPQLSLNDLVFVIHVGSKDDTVLNITIPGNQIVIDPGGVFRFNIDEDMVEHTSNTPQLMCGESKEVRVTWHVVLEGWRGTFTMMDCEGQLRFSASTNGWFSEKLPSPGCCLGGKDSEVMADLKLGFGGENEGHVRVEKVSVGVMSVVDWRYVGVDDCVRYLQHFLLPCKSCR